MGQGSMQLSQPLSRANSADWKFLHRIEFCLTFESGRGKCPDYHKRFNSKTDESRKFN